MSTEKTPPTAPVDAVVSQDVIFARTQLGAPIFLETASGFDHRIEFRDWTPQQLRDIADWMDANPDQRKFPDGSG